LKDDDSYESSTSLNNISTKIHSFAAYFISHFPELFLSEKLNKTAIEPYMQIYEVKDYTCFRANSLLMAKIVIKSIFHTIIANNTHNLLLGLSLYFNSKLIKWKEN
jgi:hypothetical protein